MEINFWSVLVAAVVAFVISAVWYSPILFGKEWMALAGCDEKDIAEAKSKGVTKYYIIQLIMTLISFCVLGFAMNVAGIQGTSDGAFVGIIAWLGFSVPLYVGNYMWDRRPAKLVLINAVCGLLTMVIGGAIIGAW